jgi:hypothetical protein
MILSRMGWRTGESDTSGVEKFSFQGSSVKICLLSRKKAEREGLFAG